MSSLTLDVFPSTTLLTRTLSHSNSTQFRRHNSLRSNYSEYCLDYIGRAAQFWTDSNLDKLVRLRQMVEAVADTFPVVKDTEQVKSYGYLLSEEIKPLREQIDHIFESFTRDQFGKWSCKPTFGCPPTPLTSSS